LRRRRYGRSVRRGANFGSAITPTARSRSGCRPRRSSSPAPEP
jgi:hypothetical protein